MQILVLMNTSNVGLCFNSKHYFRDLEDTYYMIYYIIFVQVFVILTTQCYKYPWISIHHDHVDCRHDVRYVEV